MNSVTIRWPDTPDIVMVRHCGDNTWIGKMWSWSSRIDNFCICIIFGGENDLDLVQIWAVCWEQWVQMIQMKTVAGVRRLWPGMDPEQREETQTEEREERGGRFEWRQMWRQLRLFSPWLTPYTLAPGLALSLFSSSVQMDEGLSVHL